MHRKTYSKEFKTKACELVLKDGIKHAVVAEKLGTTRSYCTSGQMPTKRMERKRS